MNKAERLTEFKKRIDEEPKATKAVEAYKLIRDVLSEIETKFTELNDKKMTIPSLTSASVQEYGSEGIRVALVGHAILINHNGAFKIEGISSGKEFTSQSNANGEQFIEAVDFKIILPEELQASRANQGFKMHERLNQLWLNLDDDVTTLSSPKEAITFLETHAARVESLIDQDIKDNPSYKILLPELTAEEAWKVNGSRFWKAFKNRKVVINNIGSIFIYENNQVWFKKDGTPPIKKI